jgi:hypothetical protein
MGTVMMPSWAQPNRFEAFIHRRLTFLVRGSWGFITAIARTQNFLRGLGKSEKARRGLAAVIPEHNIIGDLRSAAAMAPEMYLKYVAEEKLLPCHAEIDGFAEDGVLLKNGEVSVQGRRGFPLCRRNTGNCWRGKMMVSSCIAT